MIAVDTNILVYAHRRDSEWHAPAADCLRELADGMRSWAIPWPCMHEYIAVVTHPRIFSRPTPMAGALDQAAAWQECPTLVLLGEKPECWDDLVRVLEQSKVVGPQVHDARVAALCLHHGVRELWTADRDFSRFPGLKVINPLIG